MLGKVLESLVVEGKKGARGEGGGQGEVKNIAQIYSAIDKFIHLCFFFIYAYNYQKK